MENKYQITKTVRFKLIPQGCEDKALMPNQNYARETNDNSNGENSLNSIITQLEDLTKSLKNLLYEKEENGGYKSKDGKIIWWCGIKIKYTWMRNYMKSVFYEYRVKNSPKQYALKDLQYVQDDFDGRWFPEMEEIIIELKDFENRTQSAQYKKQRYTQAALILNRLNKRNNFEFIKAFMSALSATSRPDTDNTIAEIRQRLEELNTEIKKQTAYYLPYQSNGIQVAAGSFNYYTVNKSQKLLINEQKKVENELKDKIYKPKDGFSGQYRIELKSEYKRFSDLVRVLNLEAALQNQTINDVYDSLKLWKANQKKQFMEAIQVNNDEKAKSIKLFESSDTDYENIKNHILKIQKIAQKINNDNLLSEEREKHKSELKKIKTTKNAFFNTFGKGKSQTPNYKSLCDFYKKIATKRGQLIAQIAAINKEKNTAEQLQYWCVILDKNERKYLYMLPRDESDNIKKAKEYIEKLPSFNPVNTLKLHYFKSLTLQALRKLCFKETNNTFRRTLPDSVVFPEYEQEWNNQADGEQKKIEFYQSVLKNVTTLDLSSFCGIENLCNQKFNSLTDFEIELNKICYTQTIYISNDVEQKLKVNFNALCFEIITQDLERDFNDKIDRTTDTHKDKTLIKLWRDFWHEKNAMDKYPIRINPEIKIFWRDAKPSRVYKYGKNLKLYDEKKKNRYLHPQYTMVTTITENALNAKINYAFADTKDKGEAVINYNKNISSEEIQYAMGIDVGLKDLAELCVINKDCKPQTFEAYTIKSNKSNFSKKGFLKNKIERSEPYVLMKNPSYFLKETLYKQTFCDDDFDKTFNDIFDKKYISALDLTTAKVISGKLILNGDFITHLNLKILNAKRKISQYLKINPQLTIREENYKIYLEGVENAIYQSKKEYDCIKTYQEVKNELFAFFADRKLDDVRLEDNINKTRASLVGNMVGVVNYLYAMYPGYIVLENLKQDIIESHREQFEGDITRPLEWALYRKFQSKGLVPPISELVKLRETEKFNKSNSKQKRFETIHQFGIIKLVDESETSLLCPQCGEKAYISSDGEKCPEFKKDKDMKIFRCDCGFHNQNNAGDFTSLDTNDKVAAFNIAKRGFENFKNKS